MRTLSSAKLEVPTTGGDQANRTVSIRNGTTPTNAWPSNRSGSSGSGTIRRASSVGSGQWANSSWFQLCPITHRPSGSGPGRWAVSASPRRWAAAARRGRAGEEGRHSGNTRVAGGDSVESIDRRRGEGAGGRGTISMTGSEGATPGLDGGALVEAIPELREHDGLEVETIVNLPSAHLSLGDQLDICRAARDAARRGSGVVVTHGTDTLEETAMLCDVLHDADAPIVFTGAIRPSSARRRRRPRQPQRRRQRRRQRRPPPAWACSSSSAARSITPAACARPTPRRWWRSARRRPGRSGRVTEGHPTIWSRVPRNPPLDPPDLDQRVLIVPTTAGDDGTLARAALDTEPDGVVIGTLGAGHLAPPLLELWREVAERIPVVAYCRAERGVILNGTYGYPAPSATCAGRRSSPPASSRPRRRG